jgi:hypothetical protein
VLGDLVLDGRQPLAQLGVVGCDRLVGELSAGHGTDSARSRPAMSAAVPLRPAEPSR